MRERGPTRRPAPTCDLRVRALFPSRVPPREKPQNISHPESRPIIRLLQAIDICYARIYHRLTIASPCKLPRSGPAILVSNHVSSLDPLLIQAASPRLITWMMAREYYELRGLNPIFRAIGAIPVQRSGRDLTATRAALRALNEGRILGVFPEGRIETSRELLPFQTGVALMAIKSRVPVYPVYIDGTQRGREMADAVLTRCTAWLAFGEAVALNFADTSAGALELATAKIRAAVLRLQNLA